MALTNHWLPGVELTPEAMGTARWLEDEYWRRMEMSVANGIAVALNG
ncbi:MULTISPECIES: DUF6890 family protein [unclassified Pseudomonas]